LPQSVAKGTLRPTRSIQAPLFASAGNLAGSSMRVLKIALAGNRSQSAIVGAPVVGDTPDGAVAGAEVVVTGAAALAAGEASPPPPQLASASNAAPEIARPVVSIHRLPFVNVPTSRFPKGPHCEHKLCRDKRRRVQGMPHRVTVGLPLTRARDARATN
jgi:hypothetical protein